MAEGNDLLTLARRAVLDAIDHSPLLADSSNPTGRVFNQIIRYEDNNHLVSEAYEPSISEFPAIDVRWGGGANAAWLTNKEMQCVVPVELRIYTGGNSLPEPEQLVFKVIRSLFQAREAGALDTYIALGTNGYAPRLLGIDPPKAVRIGKNKETLATLAIVRVGLMIQFDPDAE